ncbi:MAG: hypothetical protein K0U52_11715 [Gammaproteobacteria bacterium]|nr:hypothetical protein [Gammaproteobacteria bacterium]
MRFNPQVRKAIYAAAAGLVPLLVALGFLTEGQSQQILSSVAAALAFFASVMAVKNTEANNPQGEFEDDEFEDVTEGVEPPQIPGV